MGGGFARAPEPFATSGPFADAGKLPVSKDRVFVWPRGVSPSPLGLPKRTGRQRTGETRRLQLGLAVSLDLNPTAENIAVVIWNKLRKKINSEFDLEVVLYETPRNFVTYKGE